MATAFKDAGFDSAGAIGDDDLADSFQQRLAETSNLRWEIPWAEHHPGREQMLARSGEADLARLFAVQQGGGGRRGADEVVGQQRRPQFLANHLRRLAADMVQMERLLDRADIEFRRASDNRTTGRCPRP